MIKSSTLLEANDGMIIRCYLNGREVIKLLRRKFYSRNYSLVEVRTTNTEMAHVKYEPL